jgi:hypothetical protein
MGTMDVGEMYRRAEVERRVSRGVLDGHDEGELSEMLGLPSRDVKGIMNRLAARAQAEGVEIARIHAIRQTGQLVALYLRAETEWESTKDPRYAEQMRGCLSDIRKIWGVEAPQRIALGGALNVKGGVLGGILGSLGDRELELLESIFEGGNGGGRADGAGIPALEGVCEAGEPLSLDRGCPS